MNMTRQMYLERSTYADKKNMQLLVRNVLWLRYLLGFSCAVISLLFRKEIPLPFPHFFIASVLFILVNLGLHLFSLSKATIKTVYLLLPYFDIGFAPITIAISGGFLSPILIAHLLTAIGSRIMYTSNKNLAFHSFIILLSSYLSVSLLQKFDILPCYTIYTKSVINNNVFFIFIITFSSLILAGGYLLVKLLNQHIHQSLDELTQSFDTIIKGTTNAISNDFFNNLAQRCSETFQTRSVLVAEINHKRQELQTIVVWHDGTITDNFTSPVNDSIFAEVLKNNKVSLGASDLSKVTSNPLIKRFSATFFYGITLKDSKGKPIGILCTFNDTPVLKMQLLEPIFSIFASRTAAELERKQTDEKRTQVEMQLAHAHKMEAIGQLVSGLVHDFNNIISAISGYAALLKSKLGPTFPHKHYIQHITDASNHAANLINQLAQFGRRDQPRLQPVAIATVFNDTITMLKRIVPPKITITIDLDPSCVTTSGEGTLLQNVLLNLGINARDALEDNEGYIRFSTHQVDLDAGCILCQSFQINPGTYICATTEDNGNGMSKETISHLFEPFFTTKSKGKGTGLGLANVWRYIENYHCAIEVYSEVGIGTTFSLYLPQSKAAISGNTTTRATADDIDQKQPQPMNIFIVDDEEPMRFILSEVLTDQGYSAYTFCNGREVVDFLATGEVSADLVLLDIVMPEMNGPDTMKVLRKTKPDLPIIFVSGFAHDDVIAQLTAEPKVAFIPKPIDTELLLKAIRQSLAQ